MVTTNSKIFTDDMEYHDSFFKNFQVLESLMQKFSPTYNCEEKISGHLKMLTSKFLLICNSASKNSVHVKQCSKNFRLRRFLKFKIPSTYLALQNFINKLLKFSRINIKSLHNLRKLYIT